MASFTLFNSSCTIAHLSETNVAPHDFTSPSTSTSSFRRFVQHCREWNFLYSDYEWHILSHTSLYIKQRRPPAVLLTMAQKRVLFILVIHQCQTNGRYPAEKFCRIINHVNISSHDLRLYFDHISGSLAKWRNIFHYQSMVIDPWISRIIRNNNPL